MAEIKKYMASHLPNFLIMPNMLDVPLLHMNELKTTYEQIYFSL